MGPTLFKHVGIKPAPELSEFLCPLRNVSECFLTTNLTSTNNILVALVYNPLARPIAKYVRFPLVKDVTNIKIYDAEGEQVNVNLLEIHPTIKKIPGRNGDSDVEAVFYAADIPAFGYRTYYVNQSNDLSFHENQAISKVKYSNNNNNIFPNLSHPKNADTLHSTDDNNFEINMAFYQSNIEDFQPSGAYVFRPQGDNGDKFPFTVANVST